MPFNMSGEEYENIPLGRLISTFSKLTNNTDLVAELKAFNTERNFLSHKGISHCLDWEDELFEPNAIEFQQRLDQIGKTAAKLREAIHLESNKFTGHLYFDEYVERG